MTNMKKCEIFEKNQHFVFTKSKICIKISFEQIGLLKEDARNL